METPRNSDNYDISIHALRKESDTFPHDLTPSKRFQSTLSVRRATQAKTHIWRPQNISIHALRKESDSAIGRRSSPCRHFNPRSP